MSEQKRCARCGQERPALGYAPFPNEMGQRIGTEICQPCWAEWLQKQNMIINHYGLDLMDEGAQGFLFLIGRVDFAILDAHMVGRWTVAILAAVLQHLGRLG